MTIYLYEKHCAHCGLKYFGRTKKDDPYKYTGSGKKWLRHINKYGQENIVTDWIKSFECIEECKSFAIEYSIKHNIVESIEYANLCIEDGLHSNGIRGASKETRYKLGNGMRGKHHTNKTKARIKAALTGQYHSEESKHKMSIALKAAHVRNPRILSDETKQKLSQSSKGRIVSEETRQKIGIKHKNKNVSNETKIKLKLKANEFKECVQCGFIAKKGAINRWHNANCKRSLLT
jgi:hypothetical protein